MTYLNTIFRPMLVLGVLTLAACASTPKEQQQPVLADTSQYVPEENPKLQTQGVAEEDSGEARALKEQNARLLDTTILHFDFDVSSVSAKYQDVLAAHARHLQAHPDQKVRIEGHADERGTREYNIALGERRALNVQKVLILHGVRPGQLMTVSYGEERPLVLGRNEGSYEQNRRVELNYLGSPPGA